MVSEYTAVRECFLSLGTKSFVFQFAIEKCRIKMHRTIILPVVLHEWEALSLTLKEKRELRVFENRVLRKIFGPKRDDVTGQWRRLHNKELHAGCSSYHSREQIKNNEMGKACGTYGGEERCIQSFSGET
jgi:hypothetical protein